MPIKGREEGTMDILCIGHAAYDLTLPLEEYPRENEKYTIKKSIESGGGPAANAAYLLSKWGVKTGFIGLIGGDIYGQRILNEFRKVGTDLSLLKIEENYATPFSTILVHKKNGSRTIINRKAPYQEKKIESKVFKKFYPKIILMDGHELHASLQALETFPKAISILDAGSLRESTKMLAEKVDYVVASEKFIKQYHKIENFHGIQDYERVIKEQKKDCPGQIIITLGEKGLIYEEEGNVFKMDAYKVKAIDTTAAGDIFHGAFTYGMLKGFSFVKNLKFSSIAAALSVEKLGGRPSIPDLNKVIEVIKKEHLMMK